MTQGASIQNINRENVSEPNYTEASLSYSRLSKRGKFLGLALPIAVIFASLATISALAPVQEVKMNQEAVQAINNTQDTQTTHCISPYNGYYDEYYGYYGYNNDYKCVNPIPYPTTEYQYINTVQPTVAPINENYNYTYTAPVPTTPPTQDVNATTQQIIAVQQQIGQRMVACNQTAKQQQAQILGLKQQQKQLYAQSDAIWNESYRLDNSMPAGEAKRQQMAAQSYQLQAQGDALTPTIYAAEGQYGTNKDNCWNTINALIQQREDLENRQWTQYDDNMNLTLYLPY